tara:strand:+ start:196 stop:1086 length:891 start_codon:yes stop_codon:yes gene_type:complete
MIFKDIIFCIVNFNAENETINFLNKNLEFLSKISFSFYLHVIDNGSKSYPYKLNKFCKKNNIYFDRISKNYGVVNALNLSIKKFKNYTNIFIRIDNDVFFIKGSVNYFNKMINYTLDNNITVLGPKILDKSGNFQSGKMIISKYGFNSKRINTNNVGNTDTVLGCFIVINFSDLNLDDSLFNQKLKFGSEELEYTLRLKKKKSSKIIYYPFFTVNHHHGLTTSKNNSLTNYLLIRNNEVVLSKNCNFFQNFFRRLIYLTYHLIRGLIKNDYYFFSAYISGIYKSEITNSEWERLTN